MKKLLALVLALVMTLGLATVGANAALSDFTDGSETAADYEEALGVMNLVGVFMGDDGKITPKNNLTRAQAAKIIAYLKLGETTAESLPSVQAFADVPATHWAAKYVAYCKDAGIIQAADDSNNFNPDGALNGYMFGAYLLAVLGYDRNAEGITGNDWAINAATLMGESGIGVGVKKEGSLTLTREEGAQYAFEALKAETVKYPNTGVTVTTGDTTVVTGKGDAGTISGGGNYLDIVRPSGASASTQQLGEKLYGSDLRVYTYANDGTTKDQFGRPANHWTYKTANGTLESIYVAQEAGLVIENKHLSAANLTKALKDVGLEANTTYGSTVYIDGQDTGIALMNSTTWYGLTGAGAKVEFYDVYSDDSGTAGTDNKVDVAFVTLQHIYKLTANDIVKAASNGDPRYVKLGAAGYKYITEDFAKDDYILYTVNANGTALKSEGGVDQTVASATLAKSFTGKASAIGKDGTTSVSVTVDGSTYPLSRRAWDDATLTAIYADAADLVVTPVSTYADSYTFYQDAYGNVLKAEVLEESVSTDYFFVTSYQIVTDSSDLTKNEAAYAKVTFTDGVTKTVNLQINSKHEVKIPVNNAATVSAYDLSADNVKSQLYPTNRWFAYTANSDGTYTLKDISRDYAFVVTPSASPLVGTADSTYAIANDTGNKTYYTTKDTKIVSFDDDGDLNTKTGFAKFSIATSKPVLVTYPKGSSVGISAFYVFADDVTGSTAATYAYVVKRDAAVEHGNLWTIAVNGSQGKYQISDATYGVPGSDPVGGIYSLTEDTANSGYYLLGTPTTTYRGRVTFANANQVAVANADASKTDTYTLASDVNIYNADKQGTNTIEDSEIGSRLEEVAAKMDIMFTYSGSEITNIWVLDMDYSQS